MDDLINEFIAETVENLNDLDIALLSFEENPEDKALLDKIFRTLHTVKGTCGFLGLARLERVAHNAETLLDQFRSLKQKATPHDVHLILQALDRIRVITDGIQGTGNEPTGDDSELITALQQAVGGNSPILSSTTQPTDLTAADIDALVEQAMQKLATSPHVEAKVEEQLPVLPPAQTEAVHTNPSHHDSESTTTPTASQFLRVNVDTLENLMTMVSELVLTRNQLVQFAKNQGQDVLSGSLQRLNFVVSELQDSVMKTRMQPIGNAWTKFPRIVHDIARDQEKKITLEMIGEDVEIDRQVLELIKDPLLHMVRNSADHGIEEPGERIMADKPMTGTITLKAWHEGGYITIQIRDDGKGMSPDRIKRTAIARGLATEQTLENLCDRQVLQFIFQPGFSTAEKVTAVSGRGVGMDVVRTNIEKIGGTIDLESRVGKGSCFTIRIPLTLAIVSALIVSCNNNRYALPQLNVQELVKISTLGQNTIEWVGGQPVLRFRERILPLVDLRSLLRHEAITQDHWDVQDCYVIVTNLGSTLFGIIVERVFDTEEIVVKPVSNLLRSLDVFGGNTILGDGQVIMILDPAGIAKEAHIDITNPVKEAVLHTDNTLAQDAEELSLLLFKTGEDERAAIPSFLVSRIEEFPRQRIEFSGGRPVLQYQGKLIDLHVMAKGTSQKDMIKALIFTDDRSENAFGIIVEDIYDIVSDRMDIKETIDRPGYLGSAIIQGKATDILDINHFINSRKWFSDSATPYAGQASATRQQRRILIVDDSTFFRNMLQPLLSMAGYAVTMAENPMIALQLCDRGLDFDLILSDIEMGEMSGFNFAEKVKSETRWKNIPMVALSSHATPQDIALGYEKGFSAYIPKSNREALLSTLDKMLENQTDFTTQAAS
jgi:two-component system chemotaxis sensor kinase CheA